MNYAYFTIYAGTTSTIKNMTSLLRRYYESGKVTYFEIGYNERESLKYVTIAKDYKGSINNYVI